MALTLSKVMARAWRELGFAIDILATGGSATTIVDANTQYTSDDALLGGTAIITRDAGGAGASPEGKFSRITDFVASTKTFTIDTVTDAVASGDSVLLATPRIKMPQMIQAVNDGLTDLGTITLVNTSLAGVAAQTEYALPVGLKIKRLVDVQYQTRTNDSDDNQYRSIIGQTEYVPAAPGSTGLLILPQLPASQTIKIIYEGVHPTLAAYSDVVSETIQEELAVAAAINKVLTWYVSKRGDSALDTFVIQRWNDAKNVLERQKADKPIFKTKPRPKWFVAGSVPTTD
jgi:hypothetical protein